MRVELAAAAANNAVLQDALDHALQEMESVREAVAAQTRSSQQLHPAASGAQQARSSQQFHPAASGASQPEADGSSSQDACCIGNDDAMLKAERIRELQRELAAVLEERDVLQAHVDSFQHFDLSG